MEKTFCEECRKDVEYLVQTKEMIGKIKGEEYCYIGKEATCADCGAYVYVAQINDENLESLYDEYRKKNNIISLSTIRELPNKYAIGKRPLSLLLGWGEQTFSRFYDGDIPTKQYSEMLLRLYNEPVYFSELLETNKGNLKSVLSYEKSRKAVDALLLGTVEKESKIDAVIRYILNKCEDVTPLALQKLLYYIQGFYYAFYHEYLFKEDCQAWVHGPVFKEIYFRYKDYCFDPIEKSAQFDDSIFTSYEKAIVDSVIDHLSCFSGKVLELFTHNESPWLQTREKLSATEPSDRIISKELIGYYFGAVKEKYNMMNPCDIKDYAQDMFKNIISK